MSWVRHEWRLLVRSRVAVASLVLLLALASLAVQAGLLEVARQQATIARLTDLENRSLSGQQAKLTRKGDAGTVAYYAALGTADPPGPAAFLALGLRDTAPYVLRVRALALQAQLHEGEVFNPELALAGRLDFAFVLVYLAPLFLIALLYDLVSGERHAGRLSTLLALPCPARPAGSGCVEPACAACSSTAAWPCRRWSAGWSPACPLAACCCCSSRYLPTWASGAGWPWWSPPAVSAPSPMPWA